MPIAVKRLVWEVGGHDSWAKEWSSPQPFLILAYLDEQLGRLPSNGLCLCALAFRPKKC